MKKFFLYISLIVFAFCSCLPKYSYTVTEDLMDKSIRQLELKVAIEKYISNKYPEKKYISCNFQDITIITPKEITDLEQLIRIKEQLPLMKDNYGEKLDSVIKSTEHLIALQEYIIKDNNIEIIYKTNHLFTIADKKSISVFQYDLYLDTEYKIKDVSIKLSTSLSEDEFPYFVYFINQKPIYQGANTFSNSENMYAQFYTVLNNEENKEEILHHILLMIKHIEKYNSFDEDVFCANYIKQWIKDNSKFNINYIAILFSRINDNKIMYHKFRYQTASSKMKTVVLSFEFDDNYFPIEIIEYSDDLDRFF